MALLVASALMSGFVPVTTTRTTKLDINDTGAKCDWIDFHTLERELKQETKAHFPSGSFFKRSVSRCAVEQELRWYNVDWKKAPLLRRYFGRRQCEVESLAELYKREAEREFKKDTFLKKYKKVATLDGWVNGNVVDTPLSSPPTKKRKAIIVLGPSASGKTFSTRLLLRDLLQKNGWDLRSRFYSIDGGYFRDLSKVWAEMKYLASLYSQHVASTCGISDAFSKVVGPGIAHAKKRVLEVAMNKGDDILYLDTAVKCGIEIYGFGSTVVEKTHVCPTWSVYEELKERGYDITFITINTDKVNTEAQGFYREMSEGKKYDSKGWFFAVHAAKHIMNFARRAENRNWFSIADNNANPKICELQGAAVVHTGQCRGGHMYFVGPTEEVYYQEVDREHQSHLLKNGIAAVDYVRKEDKQYLEKAHTSYWITHCQKKCPEVQVSHAV